MDAAIFSTLTKLGQLLLYLDRIRQWFTARKENSRGGGGGRGGGTLNGFLCYHGVATNLSSQRRAEVDADLACCWLQQLWEAYLTQVLVWQTLDTCPCIWLLSSALENLFGGGQMWHPWSGTPIWWPGRPKLHVTPGAGRTSGLCGWKIGVCPVEGPVLNSMSPLADVAKEPQDAYAVLTKSLSFEWNFLQRIVPVCWDLFKPLEEAMVESFLPQLLCWEFSAEERQLFAVPVRFAGHGNMDPTTTAHADLETSRKATDHLSSAIQSRIEVNLRALRQAVLVARSEHRIVCKAGSAAVVSEVTKYFQSPSSVWYTEQLTTLLVPGYRWPPASKALLLCHRENSEMELQCGTRNPWYKCHVFVMDMGLIMSS